MLAQMMIDADICIKLGGSDKYPFLEQIVPSALLNKRDRNISHMSVSGQLAADIFLGIQISTFLFQTTI